MANKRSSNEKDENLLLVYLAATVLIALGIAYFFFDFVIGNQSLKVFLQGVSGDFIATLSSFLIVYTLLTRKNFTLGEKDHSPEILKELDDLNRTIGQRDSANQLQKDRLESAINLAIVEIEKIKDSSKEHTGILEAIKSTTTISDGVQKEIRINEKLSGLSKQLEDTKFILNEKEREQIEQMQRLEMLSQQLKNTELAVAEKDRERLKIIEGLSNRFLGLSRQVQDLKADLTKSFSDVEETLKSSQGFVKKSLSDGIVSGMTESINTEIVRTLPTFTPSGVVPKDESKILSAALTRNIVNTYEMKVSSTVQNLEGKLLSSVGMVDTKKAQALAKLQKLESAQHDIQKDIEMLRGELSESV